MPFINLSNVANLVMCSINLYFIQHSFKILVIMYAQVLYLFM